MDAMSRPVPDDPFGTAAIRKWVLDSWAASPVRFREDANSEEDAALGAYRDRLVVELLQNAVDAAAAAGKPARVLIRLRTGGEPGDAGDADGGAGLLEVANTGAPLTSDGVEALSTLRASAKRDAQSVGRFGAGFAAVLAVSDDPSVVSVTPSEGAPAPGAAPGAGTVPAGARGVRWSKEATTSAVHEIGAAGLRRELSRRHGAVPVLRLPFPVDEPAPPPAGYDTVVRLPLRDPAAAALARDLLSALDPTLPLVLPGLAEVSVAADGSEHKLTCSWETAAPSAEIGRATPAAPEAASGATSVEVAVVDGRRWRGCVRRGTIPAELLADRPVEERARTGYAARAMVRDGGWPDGVARLVRAPQPTDEPLSMPVLASVELPLEPSRRHTVAGPLRDWLVDRLAEAVVDLAVHLGAGPDPLAALELVPTGLPVGEVDGRLRDAVARQLPDVPLLPGGRVGRDAVVLDLGPASEPVTALLAATRTPAHRAAPDSLAGGDVDDPAFAAALTPDRGAGPLVEGLLPAGYAARRWRPALETLGVRRLGTAGAVELLAGLHQAPSWWAGLYPLLVAAPDRDALGAVPVPLAVVPDGGLDDGSAGSLGVRMVTGPRGVLLPTDGLDVAALAGSGLPLRVVHPDACTGAARDALRTLGAVEGTPAGVLRDPAVRDAIGSSDPDDDPEELAALANAVLALVRDAGEGGDGGDELGWLADLLLPDVDGELVPAGELLFAGGPMDDVVAGDAPFGTLADYVADAWPPEVLEAVGVMQTFGVLRASTVPLDPDEPVLLDLDDSDTWVEQVADDLARARARRGARPAGPAAPPILASFAAVRDLELVSTDAWPRALAELARPPLREVVLGPEPSYTRWWLSKHALLPVADEHAGSASDLTAEGLAVGSPESSAGGERPVLLPPPELALPGADPLLSGLFAPAAPLPGVDAELLRRLGARLTLDDVLGDLDGILDLLDRLGDTDRDVPWPAARALYIAAVTASGALAPDGDGVDPPLTVRTPEGVVDGADAVVVDAPDLLRLIGPGHAALRVPLDRAAEVSQVLGVPLASSVGDCEVMADTRDAGTQRRQAPDGTPYVVHEQLLVADLDGRPTRVGWRVAGGIGGEIHVDAGAGTDALARALAWRAGVWHRRHALAAELRDPAGTALRDAEDDLDDL